MPRRPRPGRIVDPTAIQMEKIRFGSQRLGAESAPNASVEGVGRGGDIAGEDPVPDYLWFR
jgi:hypothetical protein